MDQSFLDPQQTSDGQPYAQKRIKELVKECWYICDNTSTSYTDVLDLSVQERIYLIECINGKLDSTQKKLDQIASQHRTKD